MNLGSFVICVLGLFVVGSRAQCSNKNFDLQFMHLQDLSHSYDNDLPLLRETLPALIDVLNITYNKVEVALGSFSDKPTRPFGQPDIDVCYLRHTSLTADPTKFYEALNEFEVGSGKDWKESQLDAMVQASRDSEVGWTVPGSSTEFRILSLATDAGYHVNGDIGGGYSPFVPCETTDYPSIDDVRFYLEQGAISPLFIVTDDVAPIYDDLLAQLNIGRGAVKRLKEDSSNIGQVLEEGIQELCDQEDRRLRALL